MKFAIDIPNCHGDYADVHLVAQVAREAEEAGWDGFFVWDHIGDKWGDEVSDPWVMLAAIALQTQRIKIGPMVTPLSRRRPWKVAREVVTLDHLSHGRVVLGVGSGGGIEYVRYHEPGDAKAHGEMLDEGLDILDQLWSGERIAFHGKYYQLDEVRHLPRPIQLPRIPIWVGGIWPNPKPMRRAAHWDGVFPIGKGLSFTQQLTPAQMKECIDFVRSQQTPEQRERPFDVLHYGVLDGKDRAHDAALVAEYEHVGVTWWIENVTWERGSLREVRNLIRQGPPRL
jgi:alkanesulfonate monooxygenase SsuD/methylene tetrahydromethanopterin reductase-like flavin-dependent oxidoreductase (luciferase family)